VRDYRVWWGLFVFFAVLSVVVIQHRYRRWRTARRVLASLGDQVPPADRRRLRVEGWRVVLMLVSLLAMTGLVFAVFAGAPPVVLSGFRILAVVGVLGLVLLGLRL
jgi:fatty acid desaturase